MTGSEKKEFVERTQDHLNQYINLADKKASILLTTQLTFMGLYANIIRTSWTGGRCYFQILSVIAILSGLGASGLAGWTVYPRAPDTEEGLMLWKSISNMGSEKYSEKIDSADSGDIFDEMVDENHKLAIVADEKYGYLRISLILTGIMAFTALLAVVELV